MFRNMVSLLKVSKTEARVTLDVVAVTETEMLERWGRGELSLARSDDPQAADFLAAFDTFVQAVRRARGATTQASDGALSLSQYSLLLGLAEREQARVQELASDAGIAASTATRILDALERRELVRRTRSPEDRRSVSVALTQRGREIFAEQQNWIRRRERAFYAALPEEERDLAPDLLMRLAGLIDDLAAGPES
jgi:DNA-binding MarR family transcriptional regulator